LLTLLVVSLLLVLVIALSAMVRMELRAVDSRNSLEQARSTARLGLLLAIARLQESAGPDKSVTASAEINNTSPEQPHLIGVWKSLKVSNDDLAKIDDDPDWKDGGFIQWLSSNNITEQENLGYPNTILRADAIELVSDGSVSAVESNVKANPVLIGDLGNGNSGKYAWHIFDESQKANLTLNNPVMSEDVERVAALGTTGMPGFRSLASRNSSYAPLSSLTREEQDKVSSLATSTFLGTGAFDPVAANAFHLLTTDSKSLLTDVAKGGFQKDLSLLFGNATLPAAYVSRHIYSESDIPVVPAQPRFEGNGNSEYAEPIPSPDPKWGLLHSHYGLYKNVSTDDGEFSLTASANPRFLRGAGYDTVDEPIKEPNPAFFEKQQLLPVISNAQFVFSLTKERNDQTNSTTGIVTSTVFVQFIIDTVITLWNPYNVNLEFSDMEVEFYRFPLQVELFRNGTLMSTEPAHIANMFNAGNLGAGEVWGAQNTIPYRGRIQGPSQGSTITLKPGEYKVFSPVDFTYHHLNFHYLKGMILREGWDPFAGGVTSRLMLKDDNNANIGIAADGSSTAYVIGLPGDEFSVRVSSSKVNSSTGSSFLETNDQEIAAYLKVFQGDGGNVTNSSGLGDIKRDLDDNRTQVGAIEIDLSSADMTDLLPMYGPNEMSKVRIPTNIATMNSNILEAKQPILIASLRLKTEQDSQSLSGSPNASMWLHNGVTNPYFSNGLTQDQDEVERTNQYELTWEPMTSWSSIPTVEFNPTTNSGFGGSGVSSATGVNFAPFLQIPLAPATSLAQFSHAPLNTGGQAPLTTQIVGNSFNTPLIPLTEKSNVGSLGRHLDHSYMANNTLFDGYFLSTAVEDGGPLDSSSRSLDTVISEFFSGTQKLRNPNFEPTTQTIASVITTADYDSFAQYLYNKGAFNVNSTSIEAWALFLASGTNESLPILDILTASSTLSTAASSTDIAVSRFSPLIGEITDATSDGQERWEGHRRLTPAQIMTLAEKVVDEVKARGPFQSVAEFVNRQLSNVDATANSGVLQTAIDASAINSDLGVATPKNNSELTSSGSGTGMSSDGAATQITQADLLNRLAPSLTVRGDTFRIRAYGETTIGGDTLKAWCEAIIQREHSFVDETNDPTTDTEALTIVNQRFGRGFEIVSFRWLEPDEI